MGTTDYTVVTDRNVLIDDRACDPSHPRLRFFDNLSEWLMSAECIWWVRAPEIRVC